jgi:molybdopterin synthase sulfur carrier subunit
MTVIRVTVRLYATLRAFKPATVQEADHGFSLMVEPKTSLRDLVERDLRIPRHTVKMMFVNGIARDDAYVLQDNDEVGIFPPIAGGTGAKLAARCHPPIQLG